MSNICWFLILKREDDCFFFGDLDCWLANRIVFVETKSSILIIS